MTPSRGLAAAGALACAAALAGCGLGPGPSSKGAATLTVTRDYGSRTLVSATEDDPPASETVIRMLDDNARIETRYGGGFVQSIDGVSGAERAGRRFDWFFYVNGVESPVGAADVRVRGGDRIWWDYRDWTDAMRVPAVVGSWPEPFAQASAPGRRRPVRLQCVAAGAACASVAERLARAGVRAAVHRSRHAPRAGSEALRVVVGPWRQVRRDPAVNGLRGGPAATGVFAAFRRRARGGYRLLALDQTGSPSSDLGARAGLVAAVRPSEGPPTFLVTGSARSAVLRAAGLLGERDLTGRYAVAATPRGAPVPLPIVGEGG